MKKFFSALVLTAFSVVLAGCASYRWTSRVPEELRTVAVPVFENRSNVSELGPTVSQYVLREFQREGTFAIRRSGNSSLEVQGAIVSANTGAARFDRSYGMRGSEYRYTVVAEVALVNKDTGKILFEKRRYTAETTFLGAQDKLTGKHNAAERIAAELSRQIVDDVLSFPYNRIR